MRDLLRFFRLRGLFLLLIAAAVVVPGLLVLAQSGGQGLYALPDPRTNRVFTSGAMALADDNRTLVVTNMLSNSITVTVPLRGQVVIEIPVGRDPRGVALTQDNRILVTNRGDNTLSVLSLDGQAVLETIPLSGISPYGVVTRDNLAYVTMQDSAEVVVIDLATAQVTRRIPVRSSPSGLALWGDFLYITHFWTGEVSLIYLPNFSVVAVGNTGLDSGLSQALAIDPDTGFAYLPQTRSNAASPLPTFDTTVFPVVNVLDLTDLTLRPRQRIALDTADRPVNMPFDLALDNARNRLYVANAGTNDISVIDLTTGLARAHLEVGANPRALTLNNEGTQLYVSNTLDGTLSIIDTNTMQALQVLPISSPAISTDLLIGAQMFYGADDPRMSADGWMSCANCHFDGRSDGRVWTGFPSGPRTTPALYGLAETLPYTWSGEWDELVDVEIKIRELQGGSGLISGPVNDARGEPHAGLSPDLDTLIDYLLTMQPPTQAPTPLSPQVERGAEVFNQQNCAVCHIGTAGTDSQVHDVGSVRSPLERLGPAFDTPSLRWLWMRSNYFHDGAAGTLREVFELPGDHQLIYDVPPEDIDALVTYLLTLPQSPAQTVP